ncbi:carboxymuconolactone decarboxylase family protein [Muriicola sp. Z0-33]|uniref:carboxymuconolactone decarboxylase family protein n=1 Tax=Muriicola sp. Z0-33 TaxID=2816957 RepID=UPI0022383729|nr:peroxidase-related enzyme [Muriicola sp. Z0-33]MCW5515947.1 peroxidase-related enzyme [Muriicola sp. Z0-33]
MAWIKTISYTKADKNLKRIYDRVAGPDKTVDNVLSIHSLRPHTLIGHMTLYKSVLHNSNNTLPKWYLEAIGIYVSLLNACEYCVLHHSEGLRRLLNDAEKYNAIISAIKNENLSSFFNKKYLSGLIYAKDLTINTVNVLEENIIELKNAGFTEGQILEINQVSSYFNYVNRTVLGLGVSVKGDILGLSPKDGEDPRNWNHH